MGRKSKHASTSKRSSKVQIDCDDLRDAIFSSPSVRVSCSAEVVEKGPSTSEDGIIFSGQDGVLNDGIEDIPNPRVQPESPKEIEQGKDELEGKKWSSLFAKNRERSLQCSLRYVPPLLSNGVKVAKFHHAEICSMKSQWEFAIVGSVYGLIPHFHVIEAFALNRWKGLGLRSVHKMTKNVFLFNFGDASSQRKVLEGGPYTFNERPLLFKARQPLMSFDLCAVQKVPVWVRLPLLP